MSIETEIAINTLRHAMAANPEYAREWHASLVKAAMDTGISHDSAHCAAAKWMRVTFGVETYPPFGKDVT